jgi:hypothetical protein
MSLCVLSQEAGGLKMQVLRLKSSSPVYSGEALQQIILFLDVYAEVAC